MPIYELVHTGCGGVLDTKASLDPSVRFTLGGVCSVCGTTQPVFVNIRVKQPTEAPADGSGRAGWWLHLDAVPSSGCKGELRPIGGDAHACTLCDYVCNRSDVINKRANV